MEPQAGLSLLQSQQLPNTGRCDLIHSTFTPVPLCICRRLQSINSRTSRLRTGFCLEKASVLWLPIKSRRAFKILFLTYQVLRGQAHPIWWSHLRWRRRFWKDFWGAFRAWVSLPYPPTFVPMLPAVGTSVTPARRSGFP